MTNNYHLLIIRDIGVFGKPIHIVEVLRQIGQLIYSISNKYKQALLLTKQI